MVTIKWSPFWSPCGHHRSAPRSWPPCCRMARAGRRRCWRIAWRRRFCIDRRSDLVKRWRGVCCLIDVYCCFIVVLLVYCFVVDFYEIVFIFVVDVLFICISFVWSLSFFAWVGWCCFSYIIYFLDSVPILLGIVVYVLLFSICCLFLAYSKLILDDGVEALFVISIIGSTWVYSCMICFYPNSTCNGQLNNMGWIIFSQPGVRMWRCKDGWCSKPPSPSLRLGPYRSTLELAEVICSVKGSDDRGFHPAKQAFQAMRRFLNQDTSDTSDCRSGRMRSPKRQGIGVNRRYS